MREALFIVDAFVALTAIGGGIALVAGVVGGSAAVAAAATLLSPGAGGLGSMLAGAVMMGWIVSEILLFKQPSALHWTEVFYFAVGLVMTVLGLMIGRV